MPNLSDFSDEQRAWIEERAPLEGLDVAGLLRLVVDHAMLRMPPGWRPDTDLIVGHQRARAEANLVARRLAQIEADDPGYTDRLAALPEDQQREKIRREVYPDADTAHIPAWAGGLSTHLVVVPYREDGTAAVAQFPRVPY